MSKHYASWGGVRAKDQNVSPIRWVQDELPEKSQARTFLARGKGRSYGDSCLNDHGQLLDITQLDRIIHFDRETGILRAEAGVTLGSILNTIVKDNWFLPVTPGTKHVTLGGAVANDVHGKNHHMAGTFGCYVRQFELLRSDGTRKLCSTTQNERLFSATIGGLGLTGMMTWVEIQLKRIVSTKIQQEVIPFSNVGEFLRISADSDEDWEYTVAWVDALAKGKNLGRGIFFRGNHAEDDSLSLMVNSKRNITIPFYFPGGLLNKTILRIFNEIYFRRQKSKGLKVVDYEPFFYPLDYINNWNRIYGKSGFFQYQCVIPFDQGIDCVEEILRITSHSGQGSFLSVLKLFGNRQSPGMMSFPRPGITLALDFPNKGKSTRDLMDRFDRLVMEAKGAVYPAKDARMSQEAFQFFYPQWQDFSNFIDPGFSSSLWRRVTGQN